MKSSGEVLHFLSRTLYEQEKATVSNRILYDIAQDETRPALVGAAANRWLETHGSIKMQLRRFSTSVHDDEIIKQACVFLTWHGDFGAEKVQVEPLEGMTMAEMQRHVANNAAVLEAWTFVKNKFVDLDKEYEFGGFAVAMEICTRT